ncbi:hypothetical protein [Psychromonas hadalis]|uniref:hypothetical protein n=1 Tax=Psychromonas hadalis TaxID=211669 RepID=UPI0003B7AA58|nr:hypothetical protein [Psychromonas hadalis]
MDMKVVGSVMMNHAKVSTLEKVNVHLMKTNNEQIEKQTMQLLESIAPISSPDGKGTRINISV